MRRAPIVIAATAVGLVGVLEFPHEASESHSRRPARRGDSGLFHAVRGGGIASGSRLDRFKCPPELGTVGNVHHEPSISPSTTGASTTRSANGPLVDYNYGILSVSVTISGKKITHLGIASLDDGGNFRSQSIDQQSIPILERSSPASTKCQHPGRVRCELHECGVRAIASVGTEQAGPGMTGARPVTDGRIDGIRAVHHRESVMGTVVTIDVYTGDGTGGSDVSLSLARARAVLHRADAVFSTWKPHSPMSRLRRGEITCADVPSVVTEVLERCALAREVSAGWFDPWAMPGGVDPTGYVKGWAAQCALAELASSEVVGAMVNAAGDIASFRSGQRSEPFRIGIVDPRSPAHLAYAVELFGAIATSGTSERGAHLIDPRTRRPGARVASASVCGPDLGLADALATALSVSGEEGLALVEPLEGYEALVIAFDGAARWTEGFPFVPDAPRSWSPPVSA